MTLTMKTVSPKLLLLSLLACVGALPAAEPALRDETLAAMKRAATYFHDKVASHGGYAYFYTLDLKERWGEGEGTKDQIWVEPPSTPAVGRAYLEAYDATHDAFYLEAARDAGMALVYGQLKSGGWSQTIDFNPKGSHANSYRNGRGSGKNASSLDDNQTQSATQFMIRLDHTLGFKDATIHEATEYALNGLLGAQFKNGGWAQGWKGPAADHPVVKASYPKEWPHQWPHEEYWMYYTLNDGLVGTVSDTLLAAYRTYHEEKYKVALARLGDFILLAQMPEPQPVWSQQYDFDMHPTWARKFEPPAICGLESEDALKTLMKIYRLTGDKKYLEPIPRAIAWFRRSRLPDGRMARYYELETDRPLYMNRPQGVSGNSNAPGYYYFTYSDKDLPKHYGWKQPTEIDDIAREFAAIGDAKASAVEDRQAFTAGGKLIAVAESGAGPTAAELEGDVKAAIAALDAEGRWVEVYDGKERLVGQPRFDKGFHYVACSTFNHNIELFSQYLNATAK